MTSVPVQRDHHERVDPHVRGRWLSDLVLGAQDGIVNTLGVVLGVAAAVPESRIVLASGVAAAAAESLSMAAVAYTSSRTRGELYRAERDREYRHIASTPDVERAEIRRLYERKGFRGAILDEIVETICANKDVWVGVMMAEEHELADVDRTAALRGAVVVGASSLAGSILPVLPFGWLGRAPAVAVSLAAGVALLFALGAFKARLTVGRPAKSGATLAAIGLAAAILGYAVATAIIRLV
jgi:VIT1/CCC1 family predicted Fe2+/Mn2+ transporter